MDMTEARRRGGKIGSKRRHAKHGVIEMSVAGQKGLWRRFIAEVDPDSTLDEQERWSRARSAQSAYMTRLIYKRWDAYHAQQAAAAAKARGNA